MKILLKIKFELVDYEFILFTRLKGFNRYMECP